MVGGCQGRVLALNVISTVRCARPDRPVGVRISLYAGWSVFFALPLFSFYFEGVVRCKWGAGICETKRRTQQRTQRLRSWDMLLAGCPVGVGHGRMLL